MRIAFAAVAIMIAGPAVAQLNPTQCKQLSAGMGNTIAVLDKMRGTLDRQPFSDLAKGSGADLSASAEGAQAARDRFGLALSVYASSLKDFQAQLDACARR